MTDLLTRSAPEDPAPPEDPVIAATRTVEELRTGFTEFRAGAEQRLAGLAALEQRLATLETRANRPAGDIVRNPSEVPLERRAFTSFLRTGVERMHPEEVRALVVGDDTKGGYFAPPEVSAEILKDIIEFSPIRSLARVGSITASSIVIPKRTSVPTAYWVGEDEDRDETTMSFGQLEIDTHELACFVDISQRTLEDATNVEGEVMTELTAAFGRVEASALMLGNGVKKPMGLLTAPGVPGFANGHATSIQPDALVKLLYSLPAEYRRTGTWVMNSTTLGVVSTLKDGQGNYLWREAYAAGQPSTLLGRPVVDAVDMPDIAADAFPIIYGDFATAYRIYDRVGMSVLRDPYTRATKGQIRFHARRRVGGGMVMPAALRKLKMATSV